MDPRESRWTFDQQFSLRLFGGHPSLHEQIVQPSLEVSQALFEKPGAEKAMLY
jgi:hypothetical protein